VAPGIRLQAVFKYKRHGVDCFEINVRFARFQLGTYLGNREIFIVLAIDFRERFV
jgi:hypothetical protein